jgi:hypothetical protein
MHGAEIAGEDEVGVCADELAEIEVIARDYFFHGIICCGFILVGRNVTGANGEVWHGQHLVFSIR